MRMGIAVNLDYQHWVAAGEVDDVRADDFLTAEFGGVKALGFEFKP